MLGLVAEADKIEKRDKMWKYQYIDQIVIVLLYGKGVIGLKC